MCFELILTLQSFFVHGFVIKKQLFSASQRCPFILVWYATNKRTSSTILEYVVENKEFSEMFTLVPTIQIMDYLISSEDGVGLDVM